LHKYLNVHTVYMYTVCTCTLHPVLTLYGELVLAVDIQMQMLIPLHH